jgi:hypothetical protein
MTEKDQKHATAAALAIGAVVLLYLIFKGQPAAASDTSAPALTPDVQPSLYTNYNVPAYSPDLGSIIPPSQQNSWGQQNGAGEGCCGPSNMSVCSDGSPGMVGTVEQFQAMIGSYLP